MPIRAGKPFVEQVAAPLSAAGIPHFSTMFGLAYPICPSPSRCFPQWPPWWGHSLKDTIWRERYDQAPRSLSSIPANTRSDVS
ncbi:hypothetical protein BH24CHL1_BH24CHL1_10570 [soil metagenome]